MTLRTGEVRGITRPCGHEDMLRVSEVPATFLPLHLLAGCEEPPKIDIARHLSVSRPPFFDRYYYSGPVVVSLPSPGTRREAGNQSRVSAVVGSLLLVAFRGPQRHEHLLEPNHSTSRRGLGY